MHNGGHSAPVELEGARVLVAGATGVLGAELAGGFPVPAAAWR